MGITRIAFTGPFELTLEWPSVVGWRYQVQATDDVGTTFWSNVGPEISATKTKTALQIQFDPDAGVPPQRFYRLVKTAEF